MLILHYYPGSADLAPHTVSEDLRAGGIDAPQI